MRFHACGKSNCPEPMAKLITIIETCPSNRRSLQSSWTLVKRTKSIKLCFLHPPITSQPPSMGVSGKVRNVLPLEDVTDFVFEGYLDWLYLGRFRNTNEAGEIQFLIIFDQYIFGDRHLVPQLKRSAINSALALTKEDLPKYKTVNQAFKNLPESSPMCDLMVQMF